MASDAARDRAYRKLGEIFATRLDVYDILTGRGAELLATIVGDVADQRAVADALDILHSAKLARDIRAHSHRPEAALREVKPRMRYVVEPCDDAGTRTWDILDTWEKAIVDQGFATREAARTAAKARNLEQEIKAP